MFFELSNVVFAFDESHTDTAQAMVEGAAAGIRTEQEIASWRRTLIVAR